MYVYTWHVGNLWSSEMVCYICYIKQSVPSINCAAKVTRVKCQWLTKVRFLSKTTSCLKQTMPFYKDASLYFCVQLVINLLNDNEHICDPNLPKQIHMLLIYACCFPQSLCSLYVTATNNKSSVKLLFDHVCLLAQWCLNHFVDLF